MKTSTNHPLWAERETRFGYERNDCTVHAVAVACNVPYGVAHEYLEQNGRKPKRGMFFYSFMATQKELLGSTVEPLSLSFPRPTVARTIPLCTKGRYMVRTKGHVFTVVDGEVFDRARTGARSRVHQVWKVEPAQTAPAVVAPVPAPVPATAELPWVVTRYRQLVADGKLDNAARLFKNATPKMQQLMKL